MFPAVHVPLGEIRPGFYALAGKLGSSPLRTFVRRTNFPPGWGEDVEDAEEIVKLAAQMKGATLGENRPPAKISTLLALAVPPLE